MFAIYLIIPIIAVIFAIIYTKNEPSILVKALHIIFAFMFSPLYLLIIGITSLFKRNNSPKTNLVVDQIPYHSVHYSTKNPPISLSSNQKTPQINFSGSASNVSNLRNNVLNN